MTENVEQKLIYVSVYSFSLTIEIFKKKKKKQLAKNYHRKFGGAERAN